MGNSCSWQTTGTYLYSAKFMEYYFAFEMHETHIHMPIHLNVYIYIFGGYRMYFRLVRRTPIFRKLWLILKSSGRQDTFKLFWSVLKNCVGIPNRLKSNMMCFRRCMPYCQVFFLLLKSCMYIELLHSFFTRWIIAHPLWGSNRRSPACWVL